MYMDLVKIHMVNLVLSQSLQAKMMNNLEPTIFGDGEQTRSFMYIDDCKRINSELVNENLFLNIGTGIETSVNELVAALKRTTAYQGDINYETKRDGELQRSVLNNSKAMKVLALGAKVFIGEWS